MKRIAIDPEITKLLEFVDSVQHFVDILKRGESLEKEKNLLIEKGENLALVNAMETIADVIHKGKMTEKEMFPPGMKTPEERNILWETINKEKDA